MIGIYMDSEMINQRLRKIPSIGKILENQGATLAIEKYGYSVFKMSLNNHLQDLRMRVMQGEEFSFDEEKILDIVEENLYSLCDNSSREVINGTGIILHTGLGRAPMAKKAVEAVKNAALYTPVQSDSVTGKRSLREGKVERLLQELTGAEAVTVVNNNAAATMLVLNTLSKSKDVVISRGQLVEIGGAFRMPDVMDMSGAIMKEIGTTNRTHLKDYREAMNENVGAFMHVHTSNYRLRGFGGTPSIQEIVPLAKELGVYTIDDIGSGALVGLERWGIESEPLIKDSISAGVDLCCFSGDKLIGGAQSGIICGRKEHIERVRKNPFARMFRVDKMTLAALEATLTIWVNGDYEKEIPLYMMLSTPKDELCRRAEEFARNIDGKIVAAVNVQRSEAYIGSGSLPDSSVESWAVVLELTKIDVEEGARLLRKSGVFARVSGNKVWIDVMAILDGELSKAISRTIRALGI